MKQKKALVFSYIICILSYIVTIFICILNFQEISERAQGHYTYFSQRAWLTDGEAILYFVLWTTVFSLFGILSVKNILKNRIYKATIYSGILLALILAATYIDTLFYNKLV